jgi:8-oxo-dGTP diphosphatase
MFLDPEQCRVYVFTHLMELQALQRPFLFLLVAILVFNLTQRRHLEHGERKRFASLGLAGIVLLLYVSTIVTVRFNLPAVTLLIPVAVAGVLAYRYRKSLFIFNLHCSQCSSPLPLTKTLYYDNNLCGTCVPPTSDDGPRSVQEIDWDLWQPDQIAVLCFIIRDKKVLLINKKTGLGAGKVNAPGGRIEQRETPEKAAIRECEEEVHVTPSGVEKRADLSFQFTDGLGLHCSVFFAADFDGTPEETDEAEPFWCDTDSLPFEKMWEDDAVWLPLALHGRRILGRFIFDGDSMLSKEIREVESFSD